MALQEMIQMLQMKVLEACKEMYRSQTDQVYLATLESSQSHLTLDIP